MRRRSGCRHVWKDRVRYCPCVSTQPKKRSEPERGEAADEQRPAAGARRGRRPPSRAGPRRRAAPAARPSTTTRSRYFRCETSGTPRTAIVGPVERPEQPEVLAGGPAGPAAGPRRPRRRTRGSPRAGPARRGRRPRRRWPAKLSRTSATSAGSSRKKTVFGSPRRKGIASTRAPSPLAGWRTVTAPTKRRRARRHRGRPARRRARAPRRPRTRPGRSRVRGRPEGGRRAAPAPSGYLGRLLAFVVAPGDGGGTRPEAATGGLDAGAGIARRMASNQMPAITT